MISIRTLPTLSTLAAGLLAIFGASCSSADKSGSTYFTNVKYYNLDLEKEVITADQMVRFEQKRYLHGAISKEEQRSREGHYYTFAWSTDDTTSPAVLRFEYRQKETGPTVQTVELPIADIRKNNRSTVSVIGEAYHTLGPVRSWRVSIVRNGEVVAHDQSYLWE
jgi:hypothetical protein